MNAVVVLVSSLKSASARISTWFPKSADIVYICAISEAANSEVNFKKCIPFTNSLGRLITQVYSFPNIPTVAFLLHNVSNRPSEVIQKPTLEFSPQRLISVSNQCLGETVLQTAAASVIGLPLIPVEETILDDTDSEPSEKNSTFSSVVLGGTFDRLHDGHRLLLTHACAHAEDTIVVGVTSDEMAGKKALGCLIKSCESRMSDVAKFITGCKPHLKHIFEPLNDMYGPSLLPQCEAIVVSKETSSGGPLVNEKRKSLGQSEMDVIVVELVGDTNSKLSSSIERQQSLGSLTKVPTADPVTRPYLIGISGGMGSGKSSICNHISNLGGHVINCDLKGHQAYKKGQPAYYKLIERFGEVILGEDGEVNRKALGSIVFADSEALGDLNKIVWPEIWKLVVAESKHYDLVFLEAAILLEAKWPVHEVWISVVPPEEAHRRILARDKHLNDEQVRKRIESQMTNSERIQHANVVFSTLWSVEETLQQVSRAWKDLNSRIFTNS